jgi:hypothetical protein
MKSKKPHGGHSRKHDRIPPTVSLNVQQRRIDVDSWLSGFVERQMEIEVHRGADSPTSGTRDLRDSASGGDKTGLPRASEERQEN